MVLVHYSGWNSRHDIWLPYSGSATQGRRDENNLHLATMSPDLTATSRCSSRTRKSKAAMMVKEAKPRAAMVDLEGIEESREGEGEEEEAEEVEESGEEEQVVPPPDPLAGLCEYERIRLANIQQREALFAALDFGSAKVEASPHPRSSASASASRRGLAKAAISKVKAEAPRRLSARLRGGQVPDVQ